MSDLKIVTDPVEPDQQRGGLPVPGNEGVLTRRDLDMIKRDLITVRKDYNEIRNNMVILTHQYSSAPSRLFFMVSGVIWLVVMAALIALQPQLSHLGSELVARLHH